MEKVRFLNESFGRKPLLVILVSILLLTAALPEAARPKVNETDKQKKDFWLMLSEWEKNDIELGIQDLEKGKKRDFFKYIEQI